MTGPLPTCRHPFGLLKTLLTLTVVLLALPLFPGKAGAEPYRVMGGDLLKIDVFLSPEHSAETRVDDNGEITMPAVGRVRAAGLTLEELETAIVERLVKLSDIQSVRVVVSVSEYRPVYVVGLVNNPGRFPYAPRTTILQAVALAGGVGNPLMRRAAQMNNPADLVDRQERFDVATRQYWSALARRARLLTEQKGESTVAFPEDLVAKLKQAGEEGVITRENEIFTARLKAHENGLQVLEDQKGIIQQEIVNAKNYAADVKESVPAMQRELDNLTSLRDKGLTRRLEVLTVQRQVTDMQREMRLSEVTASRAQRELNDIDKRASDLVNLRQAEVGQALIDTEAEIVALRTKLENQAKLLPAGSNLVQTGDESALEGELVVSYEVVRLNADGVAKPIQADEGFLLMPGDVLKVLPGTAGPVTTSTISN